MIGRIPKTGLLMLLGSILPMATPGCGGTESGNPSIASYAPNSPTTSGSIQVLFANLVRDQICGRLTTCFTGLTSDQCRSGILGTTNLGTAFGAASSYATFQAVIDGERAGTLVAKSAPSARCLSEIEALACNSSTVQASYSASDPTGFTKVINMIPTGSQSCGGVY